MATSNPSQLLLLADHIKLSLLERQRAASLNLEPNTQNAEISRSLDSFRLGLEALEASQTSPGDAADLRQQYNDLWRSFDGTDAPAPALSSPNDTRLSGDFAAAQAGPSPPAARKSVRFHDNPADEAARAQLLPYRDDPADAPDHTALDNVQIHAYHAGVLREQDGMLDELGRSIGRQRDLSIAIGDELDEQSGMLDDVDQGVDRHQTQLDRARGRLGKIARKAKDHYSTVIILTLILILLVLVIVTK